MDKFTSLGLSQDILASLERMQFLTATPIQIGTIPAALEGRDILGSAPTGTGKTGAFSIPMIAWLQKNPEGRALVMTPTRELATQVLKFIQLLLQGNHEIKAALLIGGDSMFRQKQQLQRHPRILVGTPGRINDHLNQRTLNVSKVGYLVLDETDRMLDMGFRPQIKTIIDSINPTHQTLLFTATMLKDTLPYAKAYLNDAVRVEIGSSNVPVDRIKQETIHTSEAQKYSDLIKQLEIHEGTVIIFSKTKHGCDRLAMRLRNDQYSADAIHGDLNQRARDRVISSFRDKHFRVLVATDVAARGLDIPHIVCVINFDLPQSPEDYIHRIGRTARAGAEGHAVNFVTSQDNSKWRAICRMINPNEKLEPSRGGSDNYNSRRRSYGDSPRSGGFQERRSFGDRPRSGGYQDRRAPSGDSPQSGGFQERRASGDSARSTGFQDRRAPSGDAPRSGGYQDRRASGDSPRSGGYQDRRAPSGDAPRSGGYQDRRASGDSPRSGGFQDRRAPSGDAPRSGGYSDRKAPVGESKRPTREFHNPKKAPESKWEPRGKKPYQPRRADAS